MTCDCTYTDLALERNNVNTTVFRRYGFEVSVTDADIAPIYTLGVSGLKIYPERKKSLAVKLISETISKVIPEGFTDSIEPVTVVCLGNGAVTADSLGPLCANKIIATRLIRMFNPSLFKTLGGREISVLSPGVAGQTGISAAEITKACVSFLKPGLVIVIDSLRAYRTERLSSVIQIASKGIIPGSGTDSSQKGISEQLLGVPVISIGVPTVVSSFSLVAETLRSAGFEKFGAEMKRQLDESRPFLVSSSNCADAVSNHSSYISQAINSLFLGIRGIP